MESITRTKAAAVFVCLATFFSALVFAGGALGSGGNSANAKLCQQGGWQALMDSSANAFGNEGACVSYGAQGGRSIPSRGFTSSLATSSRSMGSA
jgi:hypothetical protein